MKKIVLIEDDSDLFALVKYNLEKEGFAVAGLQTGKGALELCRRERPDLIILDIMLPRVDGLALLTQLQDEGVEAQVLVFSATGSRNAERARSLGAAGYLSKPFDLRDLVSRVRDLTAAA